MTHYSVPPEIKKLFDKTYLNEQSEICFSDEATNAYFAWHTSLPLVPGDTMDAPISNDHHAPGADWSIWEFAPTQN